MGEALAKDTLLIFFATLVKQLRFEKPENHKEPDPNDFTDGFTIIPKPFYVNIKRFWYDGKAIGEVIWIRLLVVFRLLKPELLDKSGKEDEKGVLGKSLAH